VDSRHLAQARRGATLHLVSDAGNESAGKVAVGVDETPGSRSFKRYPLWRVLGLNGLTVAHYLVGCGAILVAYRSYPIVGWPIGLAYFVFAVVQLYVLKALVVCPSCVYRTVRGGRCASGLNLISARFCPPSPGAMGFKERSQGVMCESRLCLWSLVLPLPLALPGLALSFSWPALALIVAVAVLAVIRSAVVVRRATCPHCLARRWCPVVRAAQSA
jgi:hypothetical protein